MRHMTMTCAVGLLFVVSTAVGFNQSPPVQTEQPVALVGGMLIDGSGAPPVANSVILVRGERIERMGTVTSLPVPGEYERFPRKK